MSSRVTEEIRAKAEMYQGDEICKEKSQELLREVGLPNGLLPLHDIIECGIVRETGFVWLKQKKSITHKFEKVSRLASYETEVTAFVEPKKIKKLTGVKTKELLLWVTLSDIYLDDSGKLTFQTPTGLYRTFPASAFEIEDAKTKAKADAKEEEKEVKKEEKEVKEGSGAVEVKAV